MSLPSLVEQLLSHFRPARRQGTPNSRSAIHSNEDRKLIKVLLRTFDLGFTAFGGPPVHFQILYQRFVDGDGKMPLVDEQTYQELFSICQGLPGPASTKLLFSIVFLYAGFFAALLVFLTWSLPGAVGMYLLSVGVSKINPILPGPVYALLSGLNASTVGIVALAGIQLARKAITDPLTRLIVLLSACAGLCYNALWYFPTIIAVGGLVAMVWDQILRGRAARLRVRMRRDPNAAQENEVEAVQMENLGGSASVKSVASDRATEAGNVNRSRPGGTRASSWNEHHKISLKAGVAIIGGFFAVFATFMALRGTLRHPPLILQLFINMLLAGTIIFGGGPVVIPLLREYVVQPGWVTPRDFLIGLAIIQAFPGPNFNFAVYLGALALGSTNTPPIVGAILAFIGIFFPGLTLALGFQSLWRLIRTNRFVSSILRGVNAAAVGLVFTAVHRLWEIGYVKADAAQGVPLGTEPWWVVVAACAYVGVESFGVPTALSINEDVPDDQ
ncbi:chromate ion transporter [Ceratobasidium sp. AG-Ba]|nr:chromate ion transporter [Ceratobasidium sp. AG-Ba]QRW11148.1 chromate ion transporter [Ceratobasidium sp. AG-Ba]